MSATDEDEEPARAAWKVDFVIPPEGTKRWRQNLNATVVAVTLERVAEVMREKYPTCVLIAVHRVGSERQVIVDGA